MHRLVLLAASFLIAAALVPTSALAGENDVTLQRFGTCIAGPVVDVNGEQRQSNCLRTEVDEANFRIFARDFGLMFAPKSATSAETLGQAGFAFQVEQTFNLLDTTQEAWQLADMDGLANDTQATTTFKFRKGLPLSLELGAHMTLLWQSQLMAVGGDLRWSIHEDYYWPVPDFTIRAFVNTVVGHPQLQLTNSGFDAVVGIPIGIADVMNLSPFAGYQLTAVTSSSRLIDASPDDLLPPVDNTTNPQLSNKPEFVFGVDTEIVHGGVAGLRVQFAIVDFTFQAYFSSTVQSYTLALGMDF